MVKDHPVREVTCCQHRTGYSFRLVAMVLLYAPSHRQDSTYYGLCYTSHRTLSGTRNRSMGPPWEIDPITHRTVSWPSTMKLHLTPTKEGNILFNDTQNLAPVKFGKTMSKIQHGTQWVVKIGWQIIGHWLVPLGFYHKNIYGVHC